MDIRFGIVLVVTLLGGVGGTLMALGFLHANYFDDSEVGTSDLLGQTFIVIGAVLALVYGVTNLICFFAA